MALEALSPSRAEDFKACPQLYKFRSIDRLHEQTTIQQARGTTAHLALQRLFDSPPAQRTPERLYALFRESWTELRALPGYDRLFEGPEQERSWGLDCLKLLTNYFAAENPCSIEPIDRELDLLEDLGGITIRGILDRIDRRPDGGLTITDYKTGAAPSERFALSSFFALKIYALLIRTRTGETPAEVRLLYLRGPTVYRLTIDDGQLDGVDRQLRALWRAIDRAIATDQFPPRPGPRCSWCSFKSVCPTFVGESRTEPRPLEI
jgi:putative RecB family exonuclease